MTKTNQNLYQQQVDDFLCRARQRLGELAACTDPSDRDCGCAQRVMGDLWAAIQTLSSCHSGLTWPEKLRLMHRVSSLADLRNLSRLGGGCGIVVREGGCGLPGGTIRLPLTGEQVTVRVGGHTRQLQSVITELYNRSSGANIYFIDGGTASAKFHPLAINR